MSIPYQTKVPEKFFISPLNRAHPLLPMTEELNTERYDLLKIMELRLATEISKKKRRAEEEDNDEDKMDES